MNEEEIIKICKLICGTKNKKGKREYKTIERMNLLRDYNEDTLEEAIQGLLDLYNKEKEKNKELEKMLKQRIKYTNELEKDLFENGKNYVISKDKIRDKLEKYEEDYERQNKEELYNMTKITAGRISVLEELLEEE